MRRQILSLAESFIKDGFLALKSDDLTDLLNLKSDHDDDFIKWCKNNQASPDDEYRDDIMWIGKVLNFLIERQYIK